MAISNNAEAFIIQKRLLTLTGFWPYRKRTIWYKMYCVFTLTTIACFSLELFLSTMFFTDLTKLIQSWTMFVAILNCTIKFALFFFKMDRFIELVEFLDLRHFNYHKEKFDIHLQRSIRFAKSMVKLFLCSAFLTVITMLSTPIFIPSEDRQIPLPFPIDPTKHNFSIYVAVYFFQSVALVFCAINSIGFDNLSTSMMGLSSGYFAILGDTIIEIMSLKVDDSAGLEKISSLYKNEQEDIYRKISDLIEHHLALINFTEEIECIFTYVFLSQFLASGAGICLVGFTFVNTEPGSLQFVFALSFLATLLFQITLYCVFGNEVTLQSSKILDACYHTEWIFCDEALKKSLFLIMERSKKPLVLTAGKFVNLSLSSLVSVIRSAVSYAAVLRQLTAD